MPLKEKSIDRTPRVDAVIAGLTLRHGLVRPDDDVYTEDGPYEDSVNTSLGTVRELVTEILEMGGVA